MDPNIHKKVFLTALGTPIYLSTDGGSTWTPSMDGDTTREDRKVIVDPFDSNLVYAGSFWGGGLLKSVDGGSTWSTRRVGPEETYVWVPVVDPVADIILYAGTNMQGLYKSTDYGETWSFISSLTQIVVQGITVDPNDHERVFAAASGGVFLSTDEGVHRTNLLPNASWSTTLGRGSSVVYAETKHAGVFKGLAAPEQQGGHMSRVVRLGVTQLAAGAMLSVWLVAGCNNPSNPLPTAPSVPSHPASPSGGPPIATGPYTISGVVADNGQPLANASVNAWVKLGGAGYSYWYAHGPLYTDASGGYRMTGLPGNAQVWVQLNKAGYVQPCAASAIISGDLTMDLALVSRANLTASPMPSAPGLRSVSGTVVEMTATASQPVVGAIVIAAAGVNSSFAPSENPAAYTYSDAAGRFALCGLPANATVYLEADRVGSASAEVTVAPGQTSDIQITLPSSMSSTGSMMALRPGHVAGRYTGRPTEDAWRQYQDSSRSH